MKLTKQYRTDLTAHDNLRRRVLTETFHQNMIFDDFIYWFADNKEVIIKTYIEEEQLFLYTGWNFCSMKTTQKGHTKRELSCIHANDSSKDFPIYVRFFEDLSDIHPTTLNRDNGFTENNIIVNINKSETKRSEIIGALKHELTHALEMYVERTANNLNSRKNTLGYVDNVIDLEITEFEKLSEVLYLLNKSEQRGFLNGTLGFLKDEFSILKEKITYADCIKYIHYSDKFNRLSDMYTIEELIKRKIRNKDYIFVLYIGYYLQFHHYLYGEFSKEMIDKANNGIISNTTLSDMANEVLECVKNNIYNYEKLLISSIMNCN